MPNANHTNILTVNHNDLPLGEEKQGRFAVCIKGLYYPEDDSLKIIEWLEYVFALGAEKVFMFEFQVHPNISKVYMLLLSLF